MEKIYSFFKFLKDKENREIPIFAELKYNPNFEFPEVYNGDMYLADSKIKSLGQLRYVEGNLDLSYTPIAQLPNGLTVGGNLILFYCQKITQLPNGLTVKGDLNLRNTPIAQLPNGLKVKGYLNLSNTPISQLPNGLTVGSLNLRNTPLAKYSDEQIRQMANVNGKIYR